MTLIFEPERSHHCVTVVEGRITLRPAPGSVAKCTCGEYLVVDERSGRWRRVSRRSRIVRQAIAHYDARRGVLR